MKYIASCSFGKDSLAAIIVAEENGIHINDALYCRIMFDRNTSAELPEHEDFIYNKAIPLLTRRYGINTTIVQSDKTYCDCFYRKYKAGKNIGRIYGFPFLKGAWCNSRLKVEPIKKWQSGIEERTIVIGIAADEKKRIARKAAQKAFLPLVKFGVTEIEAFDICKRNDLLSPAYNNGRARLGCWFCHNQRIGELRRLRHEYPDLWEKLMALDANSITPFKPGKTLQMFDKRFGLEDMQMSLFDSMV